MNYLKKIKEITKSKKNIISFVREEQKREDISQKQRDILNRIESLLSIKVKKVKEEAA